MFNKGDVVRVSAIVKTQYQNVGGKIDTWWDWKVIHQPNAIGMVKLLVRFEAEAPRFGVILGWSYLATGRYDGSRYGYEEPQLIEDIRHRVYVVEILDGNDRYIKPSRCLEEDLELFDDINCTLALDEHTTN